MGVKQLYTNNITGVLDPSHIGRIDYLVENEWEVVASISLTPGSFDVYAPYFEILEAAGIPFWFNLEMDMNTAPWKAPIGTPYDPLDMDTEPMYPYIGGVPNHILDTPYATFEDYWTDAVAEYMTLPAEGWIWEVGAVNGLDWFNDNARSGGKKIEWWQGQYSGVYGTNWDWNFIDGVWVSSTWPSADWFTSRVDAVVLEMYYENWVYSNVADICNDLLKPAGVGVGALVIEGEGVDPCFGTTKLAEQIKMTDAHLHRLKSLIGPFDISQLCANGGVVDGVGQETVEQRCERWTNLCLTEPYTKPTRDMAQRGITLNYYTPSYCRYDAPLIDSFSNTGNELIMLKEYSDTPCKVHEITVTGPATEQDYAVVCSPDRGTFIGPYPLEQFGALPTITYDNTNLYVSILKDVPA